MADCDCGSCDCGSCDCGNCDCGDCGNCDCGDGCCENCDCNCDCNCCHYCGCSDCSCYSPSTDPYLCFCFDYSFSSGSPNRRQANKKENVEASESPILTQPTSQARIPENTPNAVILGLSPPDGINVSNTKPASPPPSYAEATKDMR